MASTDHGLYVATVRALLADGWRRTNPRWTGLTGPGDHDLTWDTDGRWYLRVERYETSQPGWRHLMADALVAEVATVRQAIDYLVVAGILAPPPAKVVTAHGDEWRRVEPDVYVDDDNNLMGLASLRDDEDLAPLIEFADGEV